MSAILKVWKCTFTYFYYVFVSKFGDYKIVQVFQISFKLSEKFIQEYLIDWW